MTAWVRVVDVSRNQGAIDFARLYATGVRSLILRASHGQTIDDHYAGYYRSAIAAGFEPGDICVYTFINPKRGTGAQCAVATLDEITRVVGHTNVGYMLDIENYRDQSPNVGQAPVFGLSFAAYLREHIAAVRLEAPGARIFGYCNRSFWNGPIAPGSPNVWVGDDQLAGELDWLVARYPANSDAAYAHYGYPGGPDTWPDWAFRAAPQGPFPPRGGTWLGWQFSAGNNHQGPVYGASSANLDLNIVEPGAWARWTGRTNPAPTPGDDDMANYILKPQDCGAQFLAQCVELKDDGGNIVAVVPLSCRWTGPGSPKVNARIAALVNNGLKTLSTIKVIDLINVDLDGGLPYGDSFVWTGDEFANTEEIRASVLPPKAVDEEARSRADLARSEVAAVGVELERTQAVLRAV